MKTLLKAFIATGLVVGVVDLADSPQAYADSLGTGSLRGIVKDRASGEPTVGATVVATSNALQGEQVVIADESGGYYLTSLPPGIYTLTVYYNDTTFSRGNVLVQVGKEAVVNIAVDTAASKGETITIAGSAPIVDQGTTKLSTSITKDFTNNVPSGRTFGSVMQQAAGAQRDTYGVSFGGATSAENTYIVEGLNTTDTGYGIQSSNLPNEFIQETEVITGGYNAEFGRATGAIINVVTKTGSNEFHGSVFGHLEPSAFTAESKPILREGTAIDRTINQDYEFDVGAELGGPIIKDKLWFHVGFTPTRKKETLRRIVNRSIDVRDNTNNELMEGGDGFADINQSTGFTEREEVDSKDFTSTYQTYFFTAKLNGAISSNHQWQISGFGNPENREAVFTGTVHDPRNMRAKTDTGAYDVSAKWVSKFNEGKTQVDAVVGFHNGFTREKPLDSSSDIPGIAYEYTRSLYDFVDREGAGIGECQDGGPDDPYPNIRNCPVQNYVDGGIGFIEDRTNNRTSAAVSVTQRVKALGQHVFKVGFDLEYATYDSGRRFSGGSFLTRADNGSFNVREYLQFDESGDVPCGGDLAGDGMQDATCTVITQLNADTTNRNLAGYIQDSWQILPNLTLNLGLRWEQQTGYTAKFLQGVVAADTGEVIPKVGYQLDNLLAPRLGFIYDPTQEGKSKIFGHWGRFFENVPMDLNVRQFGGETTREITTDPDAPNCDLDHDFGTGLSQAIIDCSRSEMGVDDVQALGGSISYVAPDLKGQYTQELVLGTEYEVLPDMTVGANYIHRSMPMVIEDMSTDGANHYFIGNPSRDYSSQAEELERQAMAVQAMDADRAALLRGRAEQLRAAKGFDPPSRNYDALELIVKKRPTGGSLLQAKYTYSRALGNYPGLFSTETGQLDPNITSQYDLPDLMPNRYGPGGLDRPHNLKLDGYYTFDLKQAGLVVLGASFTAQSGTARNTLAAHPIYGQGESYLLPRGELYRSPMTSQLDTHISYGYQLNRTTRLEGFVDIFNLFNSQTETDVDEIYSIQSSLPIVGGDTEDLQHSKRTQSRRQMSNVITASKNFQKLNDHQDPLSARVGFRLTF